MDLDLDAASVAQLRAGLASGAISAAEVLDECLSRIAGRDGLLASVLRLDPTAAEQAAASDRRRAAGRAGPLEGIPVLIKDNIAVTGLPTTAGSRALAASEPADAPLVSRLRAAGATIVGKANLSEWANFRSTHSTSGWSAVGGQTRNPHVLDRNTSGSSSGSAAAVAAGFVPLAVGTETDGSILSPAGVCGVVGYKPELGTVPGAGIVPISSAQDTAGPMTRHVADAALLYSVLAAAPVPALHEDALRGARLGIWRPPGGEAAAAVLDAAVGAIEAAGASTVDITLATRPVGEFEWPALVTEFRHEIDRYLAAAPGAAVRSLAELVEFNRTDELELAHFGQELFEQALAAAPVTDPAYREQRAQASGRARALLDEALAGHALDAIVALTNTPAWPIDYALGDPAELSTSSPAAVAGYPSITVPAGFAGPLPVGISLLGGAGSAARLFDLAFAFEQATRARRAPGWLPALP